MAHKRLSSVEALFGRQIKESETTENFDADQAKKYLDERWAEMERSSKESDRLKVVVIEGRAAKGGAWQMGAPALGAGFMQRLQGDVQSQRGKKPQ